MTGCDAKRSMLSGMRARVMLLCSLAVCTLLGGPLDDPKELLLQFRAHLMESVGRLPKYMCTQTIDRAQYAAARSVQPTTGCGELLQEERPAGLKPFLTDRLRLDVAIAGAREIYSWVGEARFDNGDLFQLIRDGAVQTGGYSDFLSSIFGHSAAEFSYLGDLKGNGHALAEFEFEVQVEKSDYVFGNRHKSVTTGYAGTFVVDPQSLDLVRLVIRTNQLPAEVSSCQATTTLDYGRVRLNDSDFLLPTEARLNIVDIDGGEQENRTVFTSCRQFLGESTVSFGEAPVRPSRSGSNAGTGRVLPPGLEFKLVFTQPIDTGTAAAGDRLNAKLSSDIRDASSKRILVPKGSPVTVRIRKIEYYLGPPSTLTIAVKPEAVEIGGVSRRLTATMNPETKRFEKQADLSRRIPLGSFNTMQDPGVFRLRNVPPNYFIRSGVESTWTTAAPEK
jgi:hypothetical protein